MSYLKTTLIYAVAPALFYPIYFLIANIIDTILGEQLLLNWWQFDSRTTLFEIFLHDWLQSLPVMFGIFYLLILPVRYLLSRFNSHHLLTSAIICTILFCALSYLLGFRNQSLIVNSLSVLVFLGLRERKLSV